jgi:hypothetical protein
VSRQSRSIAINVDWWPSLLVIFIMISLWVMLILRNDDDDRAAIQDSLVSQHNVAQALTLHTGRMLDQVRLLGRTLAKADNHDPARERASNLPTCVPRDATRHKATFSPVPCRRRRFPRCCGRNASIASMRRAKKTRRPAARSHDGLIADQCLVPIHCAALPSLVSLHSTATPEILVFVPTFSNLPASPFQHCGAFFAAGAGVAAAGAGVWVAQADRTRAAATTIRERMDETSGK